MSGPVIIAEKLKAADEELEFMELSRFSLAWASARDPFKDTNEDAAIVIDLGERGAIACVVDGMGGMANGAEAAALTIEAVREHFEVVPESRRGALVDAFEFANERMGSLLKGAGATAVAVILDPEFIQTIHIGDAEALLMGQRGKLKHRTVAHSPVGYALEAGLIDETAALLHPERHIVSNGVGLEGMQIQIGPRIDLGARDTVLLCSDGVTDNAFESEVIDSLRRGPLARSTEGLFRLCRERVALGVTGEAITGEPAKSDDVTLITARLRRK